MARLPDRQGEYAEEIANFLIGIHVVRGRPSMRFGVKFEKNQRGSEAFPPLIAAYPKYHYLRPLQIPP